jgi:hypothetical protein
MPARGFIPDSPLLYYGGKYVRGLSKDVRNSGTMNKAPVVMQLTLKDVILYRPVLNVELNLNGGIVWRHMDKLGDRIVRGAKRQVGVKTGNLKRSIHKRHLGNAYGQYLWIGSNKPYAYMHHEGTRPHIILPKEPGGALVFSRGSRVIRTSVVRHPGTNPNRYLSDQLRIHVTR